MSSENDPRYSILVGGFGVGDAYFDNGGVLASEGGIAPFAVTSTGQLTTISAIDKAAVEATVTYPGAEHSAQIWGVSLMGAVVTESTIGGQTYTEVSYQPLNLSSGGLLLTSAAFAGSTGSAVPTTAAFIAGTDGTNLRGLSVSSAGVLNVSDGTTHTGLASILTQLDKFQFDGSGNLNVNVQVGGGGGGSDPSVGVIGDTAPLSAIFIGATDGTDLQGVGITGGDGGSLNVYDAAFQEALQEDSITTDSGLPILAITPTPDTWAALQLNAEGELLVSSSGAAVGPTAIAGTLGSLNPALLSTPGGLLRVQVDELPELDIEFPDPSEYIDRELHGAIGTPRFPLPPNALQVMPANDVLVTTINTTPSETIQTETATASVSGECIVVTVKNVGTGQFPANLSIRVRDTTNGTVTGWQSCGLLWQGAYASLAFDVPVSSGDTVDIDFVGPSNSYAASTAAITAVLSPTPSGKPLRGDGRGLPINSQTVQAYGNPQSGSSVVLGAPPTGFRYLIGSAVAGGIGSGSGNAFGQFLGTANGGEYEIASLTFGASATISSTEVVIIPGGQLLDPATNVTMTSVLFSVVLLGQINYDVVPI